MRSTQKHPGRRAGAVLYAVEWGQAGTCSIWRVRVLESVGEGARLLTVRPADDSTDNLTRWTQRLIRPAGIWTVMNERAHDTESSARAQLIRFAEADLRASQRILDKAQTTEIR